MKWDTVEMGEIFDISSSKRVRQKDWKETGVPFYRAREIVKLSNTGKVENDLFISEDHFEELRNKYGVPMAGDLMVSAVGTLGACYIVGTQDRFYYKDASVLRFSPKTKLCSEFIQRVFETEGTKQQINKGSGSTVGTLTISRANKLQIPLPPLEEQKRIAKILDAVDDLRAKRRQAIAQLDTFLQSSFLDLFGDPVTNPKGWEVRELSEVTSKITDGVHHRPNYTQEGIPFISVKDITTGKLHFGDCKFIGEEDHKKLIKRCKPEKGDILYTKVGATYGRPALVDVDKEFSIYVSVALVKPISTLVNPEFLCAMMKSDAVKRQADRSIKGIGVPDLHLNMIRKFLIFVPPFEQQERFLKVVHSVEQQKSKMQSHLSQLDTLFASLQQRAFKGEL